MNECDDDDDENDDDWSICQPLLRIDAPITLSVVTRLRSRLQQQRCRDN